MIARLRFPESSNLYEMFNGKTGEIIETNEQSAYVRIELDGSTVQNPSNVIIMTEWANVDVISG